MCSQLLVVKAAPQSSLSEAWRALVTYRGEKPRSRSQMTRVQTLLSRYTDHTFIRSLHDVYTLSNVYFARVGRFATVVPVHY